MRKEIRLSDEALEQVTGGNVIGNVEQSKDICGTGSITGSDNTGGICGTAENTSLIENCSNTATI